MDAAALLDDSEPFEGDPFFDVPRRRVRLSTGDVLMPALCRNVAVRMPLWLADADRVAAQLAGTGIAPRRFGSKAIVAVSFFRYGFATVGPYHEVGLLVVARSEDRFADVGGPTHPLHAIRRRAGGLAGVELALDNELALVGGTELLGLSKYLATITHRFRGDRFSFGVLDRDGGRPTLTVEGRVGPGIVVPSPTLVNVSNVAGDVVRVEVDTDSSWRIGLGLGVRVDCDADDGHLGSRVADLGLHRRGALCVLASDDLRGRLHLAVRLADGTEVGELVEPVPRRESGDGDDRDERRAPTESRS